MNLSAKMKFSANSARLLLPDCPNDNVEVRLGLGWVLKMIESIFYKILDDSKYLACFSPNLWTNVKIETFVIDCDIKSENL